MSCRHCNRQGKGDPCSGCRTLSRLRWLWEANPLDFEGGLRVLRDCAGALSDLCEEGQDSSGSRPGQGALAPGKPAAPEGGPRGATGVKSTPKRPKIEEKKEVPKVSEQKIDKRPLEVKEEARSEAEDEYYEESEESAVREEDPPVVAREEIPGSRPVPPPDGKVYRGSVGVSLGLRDLPPRGSVARRPEGDNKERKRDRREEDQAREARECSAPEDSRRHRRDHRGRGGDKRPRSPIVSRQKAGGIKVVSVRGRSTGSVNPKVSRSVRGIEIIGTQLTNTKGAPGGKDGTQGKSESKGHGRGEKRSSKTSNQGGPVEEAGSFGGSSRWRRPDSLEKWRGGDPERGRKSRSRGRPVGVPSKCEVLPERGQSCGLSREDRGDQRRYAHLLGLDRDIFGRSPAASRTTSQPTSSGSLLCPRLWTTRKWGLVRSCQQRKAPDNRGSPGGLDEQPGAGWEAERSRGDRRALRTSKKGSGKGERDRWSPTRGGVERQGPRRELRQSRIKKEEVKEGKEEKEKRKRKGEGDDIREVSSHRLSEGSALLVRRYGVGPQRKGSQEGPKASQKVSHEERKDGKLQQQLIKRKLYKQSGGASTRRALCGELPIEGRGRAVPGSPSFRSGEADAVYVAHGAGGGRRSSFGKAHSPPVLQAASSAAGSWGDVAGDAKSSNGAGYGVARASSSSSRRLGSKIEEPGGNDPWHSLECRSEVRGSFARSSHHRAEERTSRSSQRKLSRRQGEVSDELPWKRRSQRVEGRRLQGRQRRERSQRREESRGSRKGEGKERRRGKEMTEDGDEVREFSPRRAQLLGWNEKSVLDEAGLRYEGNLDGFHAEGSISSRADSGPFAAQSQPFGPSSDTLDGTFGAMDSAGYLLHSSKKSGSDEGDSGLGFSQLGHRLLQRLLEVVSLRSKPTGGGRVLTIFPLPTSRSILEKMMPQLSEPAVSWLLCVVIGLNSVWGGDIFSSEEASGAQKRCLLDLARDAERVAQLPGTLESFEWKDFFANRSVDYQGEEVKVARSFSWDNISPALPREIGVVPLSEVCTLGTQHYVLHFDEYIRLDWVDKLKKPPKVMVADQHWGEVCSGLISAGVCTLLGRDEVFAVNGEPLLNGMFGVSKEEVSDGHEVFRLIMNLIPLNTICQSLSGDVGTLPSWSGMNPYFLQPSEYLLVTSEDVRCFFYTMSVPECWWKYLAFNKVVPPSVLPDNLKGQEVYLAAKVLPMGFLNSVSIAQHVHRNLVLARSRDEAANPPEIELRKDKPFPVGNSSWRVYLDNYDLLEKVSATGMCDLAGTHAPAVLALRAEYSVWKVPRNVKKSVCRQAQAEVQGAHVDGVEGIAFPRELKLLKYLGAALHLLKQSFVTQKEMQVVCGGLVYMSMFRRPLLGGLNSVWSFIENFNKSQAWKAPLPEDCRLEITRFLGLVPLARLDFRTPMDAQVTCSDASTTGGGICRSSGVTPVGLLASQGMVRGERREGLGDDRVLSIGLFDGIGALRVALDLLQVEVIGHVSVESNPHASRVVESHFPGTVLVPDVAQVNAEMVSSWSMTFSQCSLVILGGGPPCQGVSGLNVDRLGAQRDARSCLYSHVKRIESLVRESFPWAQVHTLMESVASMDEEDKFLMTKDFGSDPWICDSGFMTWCSRPRLYWITWGITETVECELLCSGARQEIRLHASQDIEEVVKEGWVKVDPDRPFPTFTTSRPSPKPGRKPAGLHQCTQAEIDRWVADSHRFPPYQYAGRNCLINRQDQLRIPSIEERECMMGFPVGYTQFCLPKQERKSDAYRDCRLTLIGNSWSVPVVSWFLSQLLSPLGLCMRHSPQNIMDLLHTGGQETFQGRLIRLPLRPIRSQYGGQASEELAQKLGNLVSIKGEDLLLTASSSEQVKFHRLRASIPSRLWHWKVVAGWSWTGSPEHINSLELRAVLTTLRWRICYQHMIRRRFIHLTDSLVCLHALSRGRSSSRKLRRTLCRINALLLASGCQGVWGYVHTDQNPADRPSRWGRKVRTRFRNGKKNS